MIAEARNQLLIILEKLKINLVLHQTVRKSLSQHGVIGPRIP